MTRRELRQLALGAWLSGSAGPEAASASLAAAVQYLGNQNRSAIERHEAELTQHGLEQLTDILGLRLLGPRSATQRLPVFSFVLTGHSPAEVLQHLDTQGIAIRAGDLAALPLLKRFGVRQPRGRPATSTRRRPSSIGSPLRCAS